MKSVLFKRQHKSSKIFFITSKFKEALLELKEGNPRIMFTGRHVHVPLENITKQIVTIHRGFTVS